MATSKKKKFYLGGGQLGVKAKFGGGGKSPSPQATTDWVINLKGNQNPLSNLLLL